MENERTIETEPRPMFDVDAEPQESGALAAPQAPPRRAQVVGLDAGTQPAGRTQAVERVIVRHTEKIDELIGALALAQGAFEDLERTRTVRIESNRAKYTFEYETLADVIAATKKGLSENGLAVLQYPFPTSTANGDYITLRTMLAHKSGQWIYNDLVARLEGGMEPKSVGSGITYMARYARKAILGLSAGWDDDDGVAASRPPQPQAGAPAPAQRIKPEPAPKAAPPAAAAETATAPTAAPAAADPAAGAVGPDGLLRSAPGLVAEVGEKDGVCMARLDNGFVAATRDPLLMAHLIAHKQDAQKGAGRKVVLACKPPSDARRFRPTMAGIEVQD